jgi:hypothetical protein
MPTLSSFDRTTMKLLVAAFFALGGASVAMARAQDVDDGPMSTDALAAHPTCVVYDGGDRALIQGAALHGDAAAVALMVSDRMGGSSLHATTAGDGGFFSLDLAVPNGAVAIHVAVAGQPDAMAACTRPDNAPTPGLGMAGVANSNSTPAAEAATNVNTAVDTYNLF